MSHLRNIIDELLLGPATRQGIVDATGAGKTATRKHLERLIDDGHVVAEKIRVEGRGNPKLMYHATESLRALDLEQLDAEPVPQHDEILSLFYGLPRII